MLLKKENPTINPFENWPETYFNLTDPAERLSLLKKAENMAPDELLPKDSEVSWNPTQLNQMLHQLYDLRYTAAPGGQIIDRFIRAMMMIKASSVTGVSFFSKKGKKKELQNYSQDLWLEPSTEIATDNTALFHELLNREREAFAKFYIMTCVESKSYRSTLFGIVPISDQALALKLANELKQILKDYPSLLEMDALYAPLYDIFHQVYCALIENADFFWDTPTK